MDWSPDLPRIGTSRHDRAESAHIIEHFTGFFPPGIDRIGLLGTVIHTGVPLGLGDKAVNIGGLLNDNAHATLTGKGGQDIVADAALSGHIGDKALPGLRIDARCVAHIRVAVGISIDTGDIVYKFVPVLDCHSLIPSHFFFVLLSFRLALYAAMS